MDLSDLPPPHPDHVPLIRIVIRVRIVLTMVDNRHHATNLAHISRTLHRSSYAVYGVAHPIGEGCNSVSETFAMPLADFPEGPV
jgi:hypothetical protein